MTQQQNGVTVRPLRIENEAERAFVIALFERSTSAGFPAWYTLPVLAARQREVAAEVFERLAARPEDESRPIGEVVLIAETAAGEAVGFVWMKTAIDYFTRQPVGHVEDIATAPGHEGRGVASALMAAVEEWARGRGLAALTLNVWTENTRARALYERQGFAEEMVRMKKFL
jgi:ribosomal protein S18 acetylase RimI-like enzyme